MIFKDGDEMRQWRGIHLGNNVRKRILEGILRGSVGLFTLSLGIGCMGLGMRTEPQVPEFEFATVASEMLEQAMDMLPVLFASVPDVGQMVIVD